MTRRQPSVDEMTFANQILAAADERARRIVRAEIPSNRIGTVTAIDVANTAATVQLPGSVVASPGFVYAARMAPVVGDRVRVVILPTGDRYVAEVYGVASEGTTFPAQPAYGNNRPFYRTDRDLWYFYDGTRWLCTCLHYATVFRAGTIAAGEVIIGRIPHPGRSALWNIFVTRLHWSLYFLGATNDATNRWLCRFYSINDTTVVLEDGQETDSEGASSGQKTITRIHNRGYGDGSYDAFDMRIAEQGAPSDVSDVSATIEFRFTG